MISHIFFGSLECTGLLFYNENIEIIPVILFKHITAQLSENTTSIFFYFKILEYHMKTSSANF